MKKILLAFCILAVFSGTANGMTISDWAKEDYKKASESGIIAEEIIRNDLRGNITREEFCSLALNLYRELTGEVAQVPEDNPFSDCDNSDVLACYGLGIVNGRSETEFEPKGEITRQEMARLVVNTLKASGCNPVIMKQEADRLISKFTDSANIPQWAYAEMAILLDNSIISGVSETELEPASNLTREQALAVSQRTYKKFSDKIKAYPFPQITIADEGVYAEKESNLKITSMSGVSGYYLIVKNKTSGEIEVRRLTNIKKDVNLSFLTPGEEYILTAEVKFSTGAATYSYPVEVTPKQRMVEYEEESPEKDEEIKEEKEEKEEQNDYEKSEFLTLSQKEKRVFPDGVRFTSEEEAEEYMVEITVPVWNFDYDGELVRTKRTLEVNVFLKDDILKIFEEIYEAEVPFPIKNVSGYCFRNTAFGKLSEHSYGTCIDINYNENYYCYADGSAITGEGWYPGENPYSITPDGIVVKTFEKYGWEWGGNWDGAVIDYMHFTYLGK